MKIIFFVGVLGLLLSACTHTINMRSFALTGGGADRVKGKTVAVVLLPLRVAPESKSSSDGHNYIYQGFPTSIGNALKARLAGQAKSVDVFTDASKVQNYDVAIYPEVSVRMVNDFWTHGCLIKYRTEVRDRANRVVADESGEGKRNWYAIPSAEGKCQEAMTEVFDRVTTKALGH